MRFLLLAGLLLFTAPARADALVTLCNSDDQAGPGTNFATAIAQGGTISFNCPGHPVLSITHVHTIVRPTEIDGGDALSLRLAAVGDVQMLFDSGQPLGVRNIELVGNGEGVAVDTLGAPVLVDRVSFNNFRIGVAASANRLTVSNSSFNSLEWGVVAHTANPTSITASSFIRIHSGPLRIFGGNLTLDQLSVQDSGQSTIEAEGGQPCTAFVLHSNFFHNTAAPGQGGGALVLGCDTTMRDSQFSSNSAPGDGGAILIVPGPTQISMRNTTFTENVTSLSGVAIAMFHGGGSGAVELRLRYATFRSNRATNAGGAIYYLGTPDARLLAGPVLFKGNVARGGGAVWWPVGPVDIDRGNFLANRADVLGGAVVHYGAFGPSKLSNCLMTGNTATGGGAVQGRGLRLINCTLSGNSAPALLGANGPGPAEPGPPNDLRIGLINSIVTASSGANCASLDGVKFSDEGHNLQFPDRSCGGSIAVADPQLDTMFVPAYLSPAFQAGDRSVCTTAPVQSRDVYGQPRPPGRGGELSSVLHHRRGRRRLAACALPSPLLPGAPRSKVVELGDDVRPCMLRVSGAAGDSRGCCIAAG